MPKPKLGILFGGNSTEHEVSRMSATSVIRNAPTDRFELVLIGIAKDGRWFHYTGPVEEILGGSWQQEQWTTPGFISPDSGVHGLVLLDGKGTTIRLDAVFPVLHGKNGEDGTIQGLLDLACIPYVGCDLISSANCMDKAVAKTLFTAAGIPNANWVEARSTGDRQEIARQVAALGYPVFVKPANSGSSVGVSRAGDEAALFAALDEAFRFDTKAVIEETVIGQEVECAVMGNNEPIASEATGEIVPRHEFYDYEGKYLDDSTDLYIPARIAPELAQKVRQMAVKAYSVLGCSGLSRVDFFVCADGRVLLNEINTLPGFTNISMYPKLFMASGMTYPQLVERLIDYALERAGK